MVPIKDLLNVEFYRAAARQRLPINEDTAAALKAPIDRVLEGLRADRKIYEYAVICDQTVNPPGIWSRDDCVLYAYWTLGPTSPVYEAWMTLDAAWALDHYAAALRVLEPGPDLCERLTEALAHESQLVDVCKVRVWNDDLSCEVNVDDVLVAFVHQHRALAGNHLNARSAYVISRDFGAQAQVHYQQFGLRLLVESVRLM